MEENLQVERRILSRSKIERWKDKDLAKWVIIETIHWSDHKAALNSFHVYQRSLRSNNEKILLRCNTYSVLKYRVSLPCVIYKYKPVYSY
jgi:hypothetical protein